MKISKQILTVLFLAALLISVLCIPSLALTESEVESQVAASGKEAVAGNVLIWFLCAVAFLKVSQKIDSFMAALGVNVGRTGGSMLAEAMIAMRSITMVMGGGLGANAGRAGSASGNAAGKTGTSGMAGYFKGGLVGMAGRHIANSAVKTATTQTSAVHTAQSQVRQTAATAAQAGPDPHINNEVHTGGSSIHARNNVTTGSLPQAGVIVTGNGVSSQATPTENTSAIRSMSNGIPSQGSVSVPNGEPSPQAVLIGDTPSADPVFDGVSSQEGVILTGSEASTPILQPDGATQAVNSPTDSNSVDTTPPQEGIILTGSEASHSVPPADGSPQTVGTPSGGTPADAVPTQESVIISSGDTTVHAPQGGDTLSVNSSNPSFQAGSAGSGGGQQTQTHTERVHTAHSFASSEKMQTSCSHTSGTARPTLGGMLFSKSLAAGGSFANDVIGTVARGEVAGSITGDMAAQSLQSYLDCASGIKVPPIFSDAEIGHGRITGYVSTPEHPQPTAFGMYHVEQYAEPSGTYSKFRSADGTLWYTQFAQDAVERKPYKAPDDTVAYHERIIKKLPDPPKRKDRI